MSVVVQTTEALHISVLIQQLLYYSHAHSQTHGVFFFAEYLSQDSFIHADVLHVFNINIVL